ncbi:hypothetical protein PPERSA_11802 [Pseudocohnilembus persalinus]|uniref:Uncharacterized protein n=1 Tax=Pseudocohnilembus persalinus TaxID=266149 RepID=A0A0V0QRW4_PSEPJ|nr:hypothetical protein PPERSA_11802 [Pseudocohnilembus persalinus]|eukprot:KRX04746.1 hypothetical protein PPERSA_11802 [Pseudocohnilembus persalinus]
MEISVASWNQNQEQQIKDELDLINFQEQLSFENNDKLNNDGSQCQQANFQQDCSNQNQLQLTLDDQVNELIKQHKQKNDEIYASKKKKIIKVNTSHSRGEIKILKYLIKKYGWKEVWGLDGSVMWSGLSIPHDELAICFEINVNRIPEMHELTSKKCGPFNCIPQ